MAAPDNEVNGRSSVYLNDKSTNRRIKTTTVPTNATRSWSLAKARYCNLPMQAWTTRSSNAINIIFGKRMREVNGCIRNEKRIIQGTCRLRHLSPLNYFVLAKYSSLDASTFACYQLLYTHAVSWWTWACIIGVSYEPCSEWDTSIFFCSVSSIEDHNRNAFDGLQGIFLGGLVAILT